MRAGAWGIALALALGSPLHAAAPAGSPARVETAAASRGGMLWLRPIVEALERLGVRRTVAWPGGEEWALPLAPGEPIEVELADGAPTKLLRGSVSLSAFSLRRADGERTPPLALRPSPQAPLDWNAVDARGKIWFTITHAMRSPDVAAHGLSFFTADVRSGAALAAWSGKGEAGLLIGNARLQFPMAAAKREALAKSCAVPNWPGTPGFVTDVQLTSIDTVDVLRCRSLPGPGVCDGPGGSEGEFVLVPSATLRNSTAANAADVPWYTKFSGVFPPYGNDQHPYLVWNLYRANADGSLEQVARSGLKHAFATSNEFCSEACGNFHILGRGCQDLYNAGSNDYAGFLAPRAEVIPARGVWGRCGSVFDDIVNTNGTAGCDDFADPVTPADDSYRNRLSVRETAVEPALHPGATFYLDAWYVVRDDREIYNTMGSRTVAPQFVNEAWNPGVVGSFSAGAVIDRWLAAPGPGTRTARAEWSSDEGKVVVATRVRALPDGRYRYDYAVMNFDFSRAATEGTEPRLRVLRNRGLSGVQFSLGNGAVVDSSAFLDGDDDVATDWPRTLTADSIGWSNPSAPLDWGRLVSFSVISPSGPGAGTVQLTVAEPGVPASLSLAVPVPDTTAPFWNGFE